MQKIQQFFRIIVFAAAVLAWAHPALAQGEHTDDEARAFGADYAKYFGDGLRDFGEGYYERAVPNLLRAYALDSSPDTLRLVITAYDTLGFCDAAARHGDILRAAHSGQDAPSLKRCAQVGEVELECVDASGIVDGASARVDGRFDVACGRVVRLPVGEHEIALGVGQSTRAAALNARPANAGSSTAGGSKNARRTIQVVEGERISLRLEAFGEPKRWRAARVAQVPEFPANVERVTDAGNGYMVFLTQHGIYRVFVQASPSEPPAYFDLPFRPNILRLCDSGERFDRASRQCVPLKGMKVDKFK